MPQVPRPRQPYAWIAFRRPRGAPLVMHTCPTCKALTTEIEGHLDWHASTNDGFGQT